MTSDEKIKWVRDRVYELENLGGLGMMVYPLQPVVQEIGGDLDLADFFGAISGNPSATTPPRPKEQVVVISVDEQKEILKRLESQHLLKILEEREDDFLLEVFPKQPSPIKPKTLEHIARTIADKFTGGTLVDTLVHFGIPRAEIPYPNTKWRTLHELYLALATSPNPERREQLGGAITTFLHPLHFNADESISHALAVDFNKYLKYDGYEVVVADDGDGFALMQTKDKKKVAVQPTPLIEPKQEAINHEPTRALSQPQTENIPAGSQRVIDALEDALVRGFNTMSFGEHRQLPVQKIEITAMPELQVRNLDDVPIVKGKKRVHLPKFKATDWAKITIRFIDEQNVVITADKKQVPSDYEALGFSDEKRGKPNTAWAFLLGLAKNDGTTQALPKPIPDNIKQQKKQLSDRLKTIFKNDTDPFYDPTDMGAYRVKITLVPPTDDKESRDTLGTREYLEETMTEISDE